MAKHITTAAQERLFLIIPTILVLVALICALYSKNWDVAATLGAGLIASAVVIWQGFLIKRQLTFSTYLELDKEWNSEEMIDARQRVHATGSKEWDHSRLEGILEFFEKLSSMFKLSGNLTFIYQSTLGWYASRYFLYAKEHKQIEYLRNLWEDNLYTDLEDFYNFYLKKEAGYSKAAQRAWETKYLDKEKRFWEQERKD